ncbi:MAG: phenylpyruvate tautomerase MIF-related protein [Methylobacter sp.]|jgi:phenylpyruvate tautomerase PptA (4-oxalocrotonate tautomerase family)|nr:phenylpyruvate tautomerase MIF-related protein [Methylobacter sp.]
MPYLKLNTNIVTNTEQSTQLLTELSQLLAKETGKPERYVMVDVNAGKTMLFGGNADPLAYLECKSIGLTTSQAKALSASICQVLTEKLKLSSDRIYIEFSNCPAEWWGWNGSTFG